MSTQDATLFPQSILSKFNLPSGGPDRKIKNSTNARWMLRQTPKQPLTDLEIKYLKFTSRSKLRVEFDGQGDLKVEKVEQSSASFPSNEKITVSLEERLIQLSNHVEILSKRIFELESRLYLAPSSTDASVTLGNVSISN